MPCMLQSNTENAALAAQPSNTVHLQILVTQLIMATLLNHDIYKRPCICVPTTFFWQQAMHSHDGCTACAASKQYDYYHHWPDHRCM